ncbi:pto-interacting protein 1-like isoform X2 [Salvia splendens]|uniref:pto-interacting protein 1-like isoform X2 n=1 Tax=Salvia splendens TaxID=180675 RepID=UPI001C26C9BD|nr:pto-interacting protein 1-like isoform X2 [Salvia splendens]
MSRVVAQLELALEQQERRGTTAQKSQFWLCWNRFILFGSTQKDQYVVEVDEVPRAISTIDKDDKQVVSTVDGDDKQSVSTVDDVLEDKQATINEEDANMLPRSVTTTDILDMTANFLRKPCTSPWFRGVVETGEKVAVKILHKKLPNSEFLAQVSTLFRLKHENVVNLLACSAHKDQVLVYEFPPKGSLHNLLHGLKIREFQPDSCLTWSETIKIGVGITFMKRG